MQKNKTLLLFQIINYFNGSVKRNAVLKEQIAALLPASRKDKLTSLCPTRWVERHDALLSFKVSNFFMYMRIHKNVSVYIFASGAFRAHNGCFASARIN